LNGENLHPDQKVIVTAEQIIRRVRELGRQISDDYRGRQLYLVCVLENAFVFMADLVRQLEGEVVCQFVRPDFTEAGSTTQIFFSPEPDVNGQDVLLVEGLVQSGVTSEFLMRNLVGRGAKSVRLVALLDRQSARRVSLQPDYFGFLLDEPYVFGYGLGNPHSGRNLPHIVRAAAANEASAGRDI
jgi:hypoxanthine phosphoribosyltransferase